MILIDTNVLARAVDRSHIHYQAAADAISRLASQRSEILVISPQVIMEFYAAATRDVNKLGITAEGAFSEIERFKQEYPVMPDQPEILAEWEKLVQKYRPANRRVFDTRHVAFMLVHHIPKILTFNDKDFVQYTEIQVLNPFDVLSIPRI